MLRPVSGASIVLRFFPEPAYLIFLGLHITTSSSLQSSPGVLGYQAALLYLRPFFDRDLFICIPSFPTFTYPPPVHTPRDQTEMGKKRASPGADTEKHPLGDLELSEAHSEKLSSIAEESDRVDIALGMQRLPPKHITLPLILDWVQQSTSRRRSPLLSWRNDAVF